MLNKNRDRSALVSVNFDSPISAVIRYRPFFLPLLFILRSTLLSVYPSPPRPPFYTLGRYCYRDRGRRAFSCKRIELSPPFSELV